MPTQACMKAVLLPMAHYLATEKGGKHNKPNLSRKGNFPVMEVFLMRT